MPNVKLWSILLAILLTIIHYERICSSYNHDTFSNSIQSGKIGCIIESVCLKSEKCMNDYLFGKCIDVGATTDRIPVKAPSAAIDYMAYIINVFGTNIDWQNPHTQCVLQNIISRPNLPSEQYAKRIAYSCAKDTNEDKVDETVKAGEDALDESNQYYLRPREEEFVDALTDKESKYSSASNYHLRNEGIFSYIPYTIEIEQSKPFQKPQKILLDFTSKDNRSFTNRQTDKDTEHSLLIPRKRRYPLILPVDTEPLRPPTKSWVWVRFYGGSLDTYGVQYFLKELSRRLTLASPITHYFLDRTGKILYFHVPTDTGTDAESVGSALRRGVGNFGAYHVADIGFGRGAQTQLEELQRPMKSYTTVLILCLSIAAFCVIIFMIFSTHFCWTKLRAHSCKNGQLVDLEKLNDDDQKTVGRRLKRLFKRMIGKKKEDNTDYLISIEKESVQTSAEIGPSPTQKEFSRSPKVRKGPAHIDSFASQSSTSSWSSEPVSSGIDITMGHLILSYMEDYIHNRDKLVAEWNNANSYESEEATPCADAEKKENESKNRSSAPAPYEQSRVRLRNTISDYINASLLYDHNPRNPGYIATPTPTASTAIDFWTMVWEQSCAVLVCLERSSELKQASTDEPSFSDASVQYWPNEGKVVCGQFEIHLVSEHNCCENYVVRSFYLKTLETEETRTVTQFHYLTWTDDNLLTETRQLLEFRRKVNRSFRGMTSPIVVHCFDGCGRTGTYILLDLVLNRITKGLKEINIAASLEHLRDQRQKMVMNREQYEFVFVAVAREVDAMLKTHHQTAQ